MWESEEDEGLFPKALTAAIMAADPAGLGGGGVAESLYR